MYEEFEDLEHVIVDYLASREWPQDLGPVTVGTTVPERWTPADDPHVLVAVDSSTEMHAWEWPGAISLTALVRITAWGNAAPGTVKGSPSRAKRIARLAHAAMMGFPATPATGVWASADPNARSPLASFTVTVTQRANLL